MPTIPVQLPDLAQNQSGALGLLRRLENGAQLTGRVGRPTVTGQTPIQVGQSVLPLTLPEPLPPGTLVALRSQGGRIILETLPATSGRGGGAPPPTSFAGGGLGVSLPTTVPALIGALQANQLPAQLETIQAIQTVLGNVAPDQLPLLAFLLARNVPITPATLAEVRDRLKVRGDLGEDLGKLLAGIDRLLSSGTTSIPENLHEVLRQLKGILYWNPQGSLEERVKHLREFLQGFESKILSGMGMDNDLKALLLKLQGLIATSQHPAENILRENIQRVLNHLEGAQLASLPTSVQRSPEEWSFWRIPFPGDPNPSTVELAIRGEADPQNPDQLNTESMELILQVTLEALGPVRVRLASTRENLLLRISVDRKECRQSLLKEIPDLVTALQENGFRSVSTEVRVESVPPAGLIEELGPLRIIERRIKGSSQTPQLDIKL